MKTNPIKSEVSSLEGIIDIEPPIIPLLYDLETIALNIALSGLIIIGLLLIISAVVWRQYFSTKGKSRYQLRKLQKQLSGEKINDHTAACEISRIIRNNLSLNHILKRTHLPGEIVKHKDRWDVFSERLSIACYSSSDNEKEVTGLLFDDAYFWVNTWPRNKND